MPDQPTLPGFAPLPDPRPPGRPTKEAAAEHEAKLRTAVMSGLPTRKRAQQRAEDGAARAVAHAERVDPGWLEEACRLTLKYAKLKGAKGFLIEEARVYAHGKGLPAPREPRAWGGVPLRLKRGEPGKRLRRIGSRGAKTSNNSDKKLWRIE
jgi:hypothetical protein